MLYEPALIIVAIVLSELYTSRGLKSVIFHVISSIVLVDSHMGMDPGSMVFLLCFNNLGYYILNP